MANGTVLLAEENPANRDMLSRRLTKRGYTVVEVTDPAKIAETAAQEDADVVLLDLRGPDDDEWSAAKTLKQDGRTSQIPVIAFTARALRGDRERAIASGCAEVLVKPCPFDDVLEALERHLRR